MNHVEVDALEIRDETSNKNHEVGDIHLKWQQEESSIKQLVVGFSAKHCH